LPPIRWHDNLAKFPDRALFQIHILVAEKVHGVKKKKKKKTSIYTVMTPKFLPQKDLL
jgi:hypothetical protein